MSLLLSQIGGAPAPPSIHARLLMGVGQCWAFLVGLLSYG